MKTKIKFLNEEDVKKELENIKHIDFSLFVEDIPNGLNDLSSINILAIYEPNEYFGLHDWAIQNKDLFSFILTWDDKVLNNCENAVLLPFGHSWLKPDQYTKNNTKKFELSHLCGNLLKSYGHQMRHEIIGRSNEFQIPTNFHKSIGDRYNIDDARLGKETVFSNSQFGVAIENFSHRNWFSEKILDCFLLKTIPLYWGCSNIGDFFNTDGIITFNDIDDLIYKINNLDENYYNTKLEAIEENYNLAMKYINYEKNIAEKIQEIFQLNNLVE
jgi:hypothetical protein